MPSDRPQLSVTLPRNFTFHYDDGSLPRTPEPDPELEHDVQPPPPPRQTYRVRRRRRTAFPYERATVDPASTATPIPTIELPQSPTLSNPVVAGAPPMPPKTPEAQLMTNMDDLIKQNQAWDDCCSSAKCPADASRPMSACSGFSDSSASSKSSFGSFHSHGGSCTSPEEDVADPFPYRAPGPRCYAPEPGSPSPTTAAALPRPKLKLRIDATWTEDMDAHLWRTYLRYLQDPTVTPFKMLPGTAPPLGVCHRIAHEAKKTWKGPHQPAHARLDSQRTPRPASPGVAQPDKSGSTTPIAAVATKPSSKWPRSESATRRRLRQLCKRKPSLSAHYQRLLSTRSPSPFHSSPPRDETNTAPTHAASAVSPFFFAGDASSGFSTRDMHVSLATSTAPSMQMDHPLSQLARDETPRPDFDDWNTLRMRSAHQKSQSLHIGLGIANALGSSFSAMSQMTDDSFGVPQTWHAPSAPMHLDPPAELHSSRRRPSRPFKRRALHHLEDTLGHDSRDAPADRACGAYVASPSHRRVRSRGFSLGDMATRRLSSVFTPPATATGFPGLSSPLAASTAAPPPGLAVPPTATPARLSSPFSGGAHSSKTFPRGGSSLSFAVPVSFEERFGCDAALANASRPATDAPSPAPATQDL